MISLAEFVDISCTWIMVTFEILATKHVVYLHQYHLFIFIPSVIFAVFLFLIITKMALLLAFSGKNV